MRIAQIRSLDISNGIGVGVSLFVQGCSFHCYNCFNADTWDFNGGTEWTKEIEDKFIELANRPYVQRVSILGGEPLHSKNLLEIYNLCRKIKDVFPKKAVWLYTGYIIEDFWTPTENIVTGEFNNNRMFRSEILKYIDVLVDGRYINELKDISLKFRGSSNQRLIDVQRSLEMKSLRFLNI